MHRSVPPTVIPFRRRLFVLQGSIATVMAALTFVAVVWANDPDMVGATRIICILFGLLMTWSAYVNISLFLRSIHQSVGVVFDDEGLHTYTEQPAVPVKIRWRDLTGIEVIEKTSGVLRIEQLALKVPYKMPYIGALNIYQQFARRYEADDSPLVFIINVRHLDISSALLAEYVVHYANQYHHAKEEKETFSLN